MPTPHTVQALRTNRTLPLACALAAMLLLCLAASPAQARTWFRASYSPLFNGSVQKSPLDPSGKQSGQEVRAPKGEVEMIVWDRLGIQATRQEVARGYKSGGRKYDEKSVQLSVNLALYAFESGHMQSNWFAGLGTGVVETYKFKVDGVFQQDTKLHNDIPLQRTFVGWEYTWDRVGMKIELSQVQASQTVKDQDVEIQQRFANLAFFIPLN